MIDVKKIGNRELVKCILALYYNEYGFYNFDIQNDPRIEEYKQVLKMLKTYLKNDTDLKDFNILVQKEARTRGLKTNFLLKGIIDNEEFLAWQQKMVSSPTYLREIDATNFPGGYDISFADDEWIGFDYPVRNACKVLNEKGYTTYWSSANKNDFLSRRGQVIQNKAVAYILIDPKSLTENLKRRLVLNGSCDFWGIAKEHEEEGKYYGIWSEIISLNSTCKEIAEELTKKALDLPVLSLEEKKHPKI